jgi:dUTP pyrophosphatase
MYSLNKDVPIPQRQTKDSAGYDFYMPFDCEFRPGEYVQINTFICFDGKEKPYTDVEVMIDGELKTCRVYPKQWVFKLYPRSSLGTEYKFRFSNTTGVIDKDFIDHPIKADITVDKPLYLKKGKRFMQGIFVPIGYEINEIVPESTRDGGIGSTDNVKCDCESKCDNCTCQNNAEKNLADISAMIPKGEIDMTAMINLAQNLIELAQTMQKQN